jgi:uncharacterized Tic20 family protein
VAEQDRAWETGCHLAPLALLVNIPAANVFGPLIVWLIRKNSSASTDQHGRAVLNFQLAMTLYFVVLFLLGLVVDALATPVALLLRLWAYLNIFFILRGAYESAQGRLYAYPLSIRFLPQQKKSV